MINFGTPGRDVFYSPINKCARVSVGSESDYSAGSPTLLTLNQWNTNFGVELGQRYCFLFRFYLCGEGLTSEV